MLMNYPNPNSNPSPNPNPNPYPSPNPDLTLILLINILIFEEKITLMMTRMLGKSNIYIYIWCVAILEQSEVPKFRFLNEKQNQGKISRCLRYFNFSGTKQEKTTKTSTFGAIIVRTF